jgi:thiol-disulfide isomerase/thioredoxin
MKHYAFLIFAFLCAACQPSAAPVSVSNKPISINNIPTTNQPLPPTKNVENMSWTSFDGKIETLNDLKGKVIVLDFWATYCPPCIEEIPHLVNLQNKHGADGLQIIGLHLGGEEDRPKVPAFIEKLKLNNYPIATPEDALTDALMKNDSRIPQTFVFDRNGRFIKGFVGFDKQIKAELDETIQSALKN